MKSQGDSSFPTDGHKATLNKLNSNAAAGSTDDFGVSSGKNYFTAPCFIKANEVNAFIIGMNFIFVDFIRCKLLRITHKNENTQREKKKKKKKRHLKLSICRLFVWGSSSFRMAFFRLFAWRYFVCSRGSYRVSLFRLFTCVFSRVVFSLWVFSRGVFSHGVFSRGVISTFREASFHRFVWRYFRLFVLEFRLFVWLVSLFRLFAWRYFVFSYFRMALFRLFAWRLLVLSFFRVVLFRGEKTKWHKPATIVMWERSNL